MIFRVRNPLPGFCTPDFAPWVVPPASEVFSESEIRCPDFTLQILHTVREWFSESKIRCRILPPGFCSPWVSVFPSPKSVAQILPPRIFCPLDFTPPACECVVLQSPLVSSMLQSTDGNIQCFFAMTGTAAADITCELPCTAVSIIFPRPTTLSNASPDVFLSSLHSNLSLCSFVMSVKLLSHLVFCIQRGRKVSTQSRQNY